MTILSWKQLAISGAFVGLSGCFCSCVARGSRVRTPKGWRPIEELKVGDIVRSHDPITGAPLEGAITMTRTAKRETVLLRIPDAELALTSDHPVYCPDQEVYAPAGDWALGQRSRLWMLHDGRPMAQKVTSVAIAGGVRDVFDITVDTPHHNFVAEGILVHNKSPPVRECTYGGRSAYDGQSCECAGGQGRVSCDEYGAGTCGDCRPIDAGRNSTLIDAATDDASVRDAGSEDAGT